MEGRKRTALAYGATEIPVYLVALIKGFFFNAFLLEVAEVSPYAAGTITLFTQIFDTIADPIIGKLSDSTRSRFGRRKSWLIFGVLPFIAVWVLSWWVPPGISKERVWIYFLFMQLMLTVANASIAVPYHAWLPEIAKDYDERTYMTMLNKMLSLVSGIIYAFAHSEIVEAFPSKTNKEIPNEKLGYQVSSWISATLFFMCIAITCLFVNVEEITTPRDEMSEQDKKRSIWMRTRQYLRELKEIFSNKSFSLLTTVYLFSWFACQLVVGNLLLFVQFVIKRQQQFSYLLLCVQGVAVLSLFLWTWVSRKIGKKYTLIIGLSIWALVEIIAYWLEHEDLFLAYVLFSIAGTGVGAVFLLPWAMLPDVVQYDTLLYGKQREGTMYSWFVVLQQV
eukprot:TRINITY_DN4707_c0_g1_i2.p1 TRINITY_DN4707_c0_g1~~TRINITY_DN4707_c0_g1_i2.p1  ORF type:complete len:428 (+),score=83.81 TRINITY_DN4707_c0_g1_i2:110-1285(+)